jgi:hypothetical protein
MSERNRQVRRWANVAGIFAALVPLSLLAADEPPSAPPPSARPSRVAFVLKNRHGHAVPDRSGTSHTAGGNIDVAQPRDDTLVITMTGAVVAGPHPCKASAATMDFDLNQDFEIIFADPKLTKARLTIEAQVIGLLRGDKHGGSASVCNGAAAIAGADGNGVGLSIEGHAVGGDDNLAINDRKGPVNVAVCAGPYHVLQTFRINAVHARSICGTAASAEFAPDPALDPTWISVTDPFRGANKKEFGFRVTLHLEPE